MNHFNHKNLFYKVLFIHLLAALLRTIFVLYGFTDLQSEEAQYWAWSEYLDWSYYSKPPMVAYLNFITESLLGHGELAVRINAIIAGFFIGIITYLFSFEIFRHAKKAFLASVLIYAMPFYHGMSMFFSTDTPLLLFWLLASYWGWLAIKYNKWLHWLLLAIALGMGYLSKFAMLFFIPSILLYAIFKDRELLRNRKLYTSLVLSLFFFLPVIIWNINNDFVSYKHLFHLSGAAGNTIPLTRRISKMFEYISGQWAITSPLFIVMYFQMYRRYRNQKITGYLLIPALLIFFIFLLISVNKSTGANVNWTMFAYTGLPILLGSYIIDDNKQRIGSIFLAVSLILLIFMASTPTLDNIGLKKILPPDKDPAKRLIGWTELANKVDSIKKSMGTDKVIIFSDSYHITSELRFYMYPQKVVYANSGSRMNQYDLWNEIQGYENKGYSAIYVREWYWKKQLAINPDSIPSPKPIISNGFATKTYDRYFLHKTIFREEPIYYFHIYTFSNLQHIKTERHNY